MDGPHIFVDLTYKGGAPALVDLVGGQVHATFATELVLSPHIKAGRVRALAVSTAKRVPALPDLPSIGEAIPGYTFDGWAGIWAPAGTPRDIITRLNQSVARILKLPEVQERLRAGGGEPAPSTPDAFAQVIERDIATWSKVIRDDNIKLN